MNDSQDKHQVEVTTQGGHVVDISDADETIVMRTSGGHVAELSDADGRIQFTTSGGHVLELSDSDEVALLSTSGGHTISVDDAGEVIRVDSTSGHHIELDDGGGTITISTPSGQTVVLDDSSVSISANATITLQASSVVADAMDIKLGGNGASQMALLGTMFLQLFNAHTHASPLFGIPTSPPIIPLPPTVLSLTTKVL